MDLFPGAALRIVWFCSIECELQYSGEHSVADMVAAWDWVMTTWPDDDQEQQDPIDAALVQRLGAYVEPMKNKLGFRKCGVRVGASIKPKWELVPRMMETLCSEEAFEQFSPGEWFHEFEEIHPFEDGNGRSGQILFNWLNGTLNDPTWAPDFWGDPRRHEGYGRGECLPSP